MLNLRKNGVYTTELLSLSLSHTHTHTRFPIINILHYVGIFITTNESILIHYY